VFRILSYADHLFHIAVPKHIAAEDVDALTLPGVLHIHIHVSYNRRNMYGRILGKVGYSADEILPGYNLSECQHCFLDACR